MSKEAIFVTFTTLLLIIVIFVVLRNLRIMQENFVNIAPPTTTATYYNKGIRSFTLGADLKDVLLSLSQNDAACTYTNDSVKGQICRPRTIDTITCPAADQNCTTFDSGKNPINPNDCNIKIYNKMYRFVKKCVNLTLAQNPYGIKNDSLDSLFFVLSRTVFFRAVQSGLYTMQYANSFSYEWPTPLYSFSANRETDKSVDTTLNPVDIDQMLIRSGQKSVMLNTTCYYIEPLESNDPDCGNAVNVVTIEDSMDVSIDSKPYHQTIGDYSLYLKLDGLALSAIITNTGNNKIFNKTFKLTSLLSHKNVKFAWTMTNSGCVLMLYVDTPQVFFNMTIRTGAMLLAGVSSTPSGSYCLIPNYFEVYKRLSSGGSLANLVTLPHKFSLRPSALNNNKCVDNIAKSRSNGGKIAMYDCYNRANENQMWNYDNKTQQIKLDGDSRFCWDVSNGIGLLNAGRSVTNSSVQLWACDENNVNQKFAYDPQEQKLQWKTNNFCVGVTGGDVTNNRANISIAPCNAGDSKNVKWQTGTN
jgi:hypothetical protein